MANCGNKEFITKIHQNSLNSEFNLKSLKENGKTLKKIHLLNQGIFQKG